MAMPSFIQKLLAFLMLIAQLLGLAGGASTSEPATIDIRPTYTSGRGDLMQGDFIVHLPADWADKAVWDFYETDTTYSVSFYEKTSHEAGFGGHLFTLMVLPEGFSYEEYPSYDLLGTLTQDGQYFSYLLALYPTDVQFSNEAAARYQSMEREITSILDALTFPEEITFSKTLA